MTRPHEKLARKNTDIERLARFMGYEYVPEEGQSGCGEYWRSIDEDGSQPHWDEFDPFTCLNDAMMVAEKIGGLVLTALPEMSDPNKKWDASFWKAPGGKSYTSAFGDTPSEAIALAALAYIEATEKVNPGCLSPKCEAGYETCSVCRAAGRR